MVSPSRENVIVLGERVFVSLALRIVSKPTGLAVSKLLLTEKSEYG